MENEELETFVEVETGSESYDDYITFGDIALITFLAILGCAVFAFIMKIIRKNIKNAKIKLGDKIEVSVESKDNTDEKKLK